MSSSRVLVVDDNPDMTQAICQNLARHGFEAEAASSGKAAMQRFGEAPFDAVLTDLRMADADGLEVLDAVKKADPDVPVIIMTAFGAIESAVEAIRRGAYHYVAKPFKMDAVRLLLSHACAERALLGENRQLREKVTERYSFESLVGQSTAMRQIFTLIERLAQSTSPVLVQGETGTGKELVARALHQIGPRSKAPFLAVNCAAVPEALLESELFGHARGAFTGAVQVRRGLLVEADGGTVLLDEIGDMPSSLQAKLLRVLETGTVRPVGSDTDRKVDVRFVAATHRDLAERARTGSFREDLFFRLKVLSLAIPPLRDRKDDIPLLVKHFLALSRQRNPTSPVQSLSPAALRELLAHSWPGNVRELEHTIERLVVAGTQAEVPAEAVRADIEPWEVEGKGHPFDRARTQLLPLRELTQLYIDWVVGRVGGNRTRAAELLGVHPSTLYRREQNKEQ
jgi:two-component system, NtrC family, response regulator HydG